MVQQGSIASSQLQSQWFNSDLKLLSVQFHIFLSYLCGLPPDSAVSSHLPVGGLDTLNYLFMNVHPFRVYSSLVRNVKLAETRIKQLLNMND